MIKNRAFSVVYMFVITLVFTSVVSAFYVLNRDRIQANEQGRLQSIVLEVLGIRPSEASAKAGAGVGTAAVFQTRVRPLEIDGRKVYTGLAEDGKTVSGYAFSVSGPGFWGPIQGMIGVDPKLERVLGIAFYDHSETPGLGGRITEPWFTAQFVGKRLATAGPDQPYFVLKAPGAARAPTDLDAITGATGTSNKLQGFLNRTLQDMLPRLKAQQARGAL